MRLPRDEPREMVFLTREEYAVVRDAVTAVSLPGVYWQLRPGL
jgi:hypothetical protein